LAELQVNERRLDRSAYATGGARGRLRVADGVDAPPTASCAKVVVVEDRDKRRGVRGER